MSDSDVRVQRDLVARCIRLVLDGDEVVLDAETAISLGEALVRQGREVESPQSNLVDERDEGQRQLTEIESDGSDSVDAALARVQSRGPRGDDPDAMLNPNDPLDW